MDKIQVVTDTYTVNNERPTIRTILPIRQALVIRFLLEVYLSLIVATLFLPNGLFMIMSYVSV